MGFIDWIKGVGSWINEKVLQPAGRWLGGVWNGMTGKGRPDADPKDVATNAGYQSGQWFGSWGLPIIKSAANVLAPGVGAGIDEMQKGIERATGSKIQ